MPVDPAQYAPTAPTLDHVFELEAGPYQSGELRVLSFDGREEMNGLYAFDIVVWGKDIDEGQIETAVLGMPAALAMHLPDGSARYVRGIVVGVTLEGLQAGAWLPLAQQVQRNGAFIRWVACVAVQNRFNPLGAVAS